MLLKVFTNIEIKIILFNLFVILLNNNVINKIYSVVKSIMKSINKGGCKKNGEI